MGGQAWPSPLRLLPFGVGILCVSAGLSRRLWNGRAIPKWFIGTVLFAPCVGLGAACLAKSDLEHASYYAVGSFLLYWQIQAWLFESKKKVMPEL